MHKIVCIASMVLAGLSCAVSSASETERTDLGLFSQGDSDQPPASWQAQFHPDIPKRTDLSLVHDKDQLLLQVQSQAGYGSWAYRFQQPTEVTSIAWSWQVNQHPSDANLMTKEGDDSAIKVCLFVAIDESKLGLGTRLALGAARTFSGENLPAATLCYQWSSQALDTQLFDNPYTDRVRNLVLRTEPAGDQWLPESRNIQQDVVNAFGSELPKQNGALQVRLLGLAIGGDADNTQSSSLAHLKNLHLDLIPSE